MFADFKKCAAVAVMMLIGFGAVQSANAAVFNIDPGDSNVLVFNNMFLTGNEEKAANESFTDIYSFFLVDTDGNGSESVWYGFDVTFQSPQISGVGIANLTFTIRDETNSALLREVIMTDADGIGAGSAFNFVGVWPAPIELTLTVTGTALQNGGSYNASIVAVPLPAPLMLFISALLGLGFLSRRRMIA